MRLLLKIVNDTHREKLYFAQFCAGIYWNTRLDASDLFDMLTESIKFYVFISHINKKYRYLEKNLDQIDRRWMVTPFSNFYRKIWVIFVLTRESALS